VFPPAKRLALLLPLLLATVMAPSSADAFALNGYRWPEGTGIVMRLSLSRPPVSFQDGSASWNASAADALKIWNQHVDTVTFVEGGQAPAGEGDAVNTVFFATSIYGESFGANTLAVTVYYRGPNNTFSETDVIFNNKLKWGSYRGPLQGSGPNATYDLHRVALHEFGHALGLSHPDEKGQSFTAIMNSQISDLDALAQDDIDGARSIYGLKITSSLNPPSVQSGSPFSYQITASNNPINFSATGLPPGLQLNASSGLISGVPTTSGTFLVDVVVQGAFGVATARIQIAIVALPLTSGSYFPDVPVGADFSYQITASNNPTSFTATGLPAGLSLDPNIGRISGIPTVTGTFSVLIKAIGPTAEASATLQIVISPPRITSYFNPPPVELGSPFSYQITATHNPSGFNASNLPAGLEFNPNTGLISGTATVAGFFYVPVTAQTAFGNANGYLYISILAPRITSGGPYSVDIGTAFTVQVKASHGPTSFSATGLPPGLKLDQGTGVISGVPELSGQYSIQLSAQGTTGTATQSTYIQVWPLDTPTEPIAKISTTGGAMIADPIRPRIYVANGYSVLVINTVSLEISEVGLWGGGSGSNYEEPSISADGNKLWLPVFSSKTLKSVDLNTLTSLPDLQVSVSPRRAREGADGRLYLTGGGTSEEGVYQVDPSTGATLARFGPKIGETFYPCTIEMSPDRKTLYVAETQGEAGLSSYRIAPGISPTFLQRVQAAPYYSIQRQIVVNPNGQTVALVSAAFGYSVPDPVVMRASNDLNVVRFTMTFPPPLGQTAFSPNGSLLFQTRNLQSSIDVFDDLTHSVTRRITLPDRAVVSHYSLATAVDKDNSRLFVRGGPSGGTIYIFPVVPPSGPPAPPKSLINVSTRLRSQTGDDVLIGGFVISGTEPKKMIIRAMGPSLPVPGKLADPVLALHASDGSVLAQNDNWNARRTDVLSTGFVPNDEHESAIVTTLQPGAYTAILRGLGGTAGVALVEVYDLSPESNSRIINISTRGKVETADNVMIGGFVIGGDQPTKVMVRALGPSLAAHGVPGVLADTNLNLHDSNGAIIASNDDWQTDQKQEIIDSNIPPPGDPRETAIVRTLAPGPYTAIVRGKNNVTGVALVEVYNLEPN